MERRSNGQERTQEAEEGAEERERHAWRQVAQLGGFGVQVKNKVKGGDGKWQRKVSPMKQQ